MSCIPGAILGLFLPSLILFFASPEHDSVVPTWEHFHSAKLRIVERVKDFDELLPLNDDIKESSFSQFLENLVENIQEFKKNIPQIIKGE